MLKNSQFYLFPCIHKLFNNCFTYGIYPQAWSNGSVSPNFKSDDPNNPANYRDITITSTLGKLFSSILNSRLEKFLKKTQFNSHISDWFYQRCENIIYLCLNV